MPNSPQVRCPKCGGKQPKRTSDSIYWCGKCRCQFDDSPDEGGDYSDRDPSARLERQERRQTTHHQHKRR